MTNRTSILDDTERRQRHLALVAVPAGVDGITTFERRRFDGPPPVARPSDRLEPWLLENNAEVAAFADASYERGIPFQTAVSVVVERQLIGEALEARGKAAVALDLDLRARQTVVGCELSDGMAAYARLLSAGARDLDRKPQRIVALPMRLNERLGGGNSVSARLDPRLLDSALAWERASVVGGMTMTEWAACAALELEMAS